MKYNWKLKEYIFNYAANTITYAKLNLDGIAENYSPQTLQRGTFPNIVNGPAIKHLNQDKMRNFPTFDHVTCFWCPQWPKEAQSWLYRPRCHGWPSTDIISEVEQSGCHLVYIQHRSCRDDELRVQWRFSFSFAELILLQSWTQTQQIVYHLLRFFAKRRSEN